MDNRDDLPESGTEEVDLGDADVSAVDLPPEPGHERSLPPPLPPEIRAPSLPPASVAPPGRSNRFWVIVLVGVLAVGIVGGIAVAMGTRGEKKPEPRGAGASAAPNGSVMKLPTIDMTDEGDAGN